VSANGGLANKKHFTGFGKAQVPSNFNKNQMVKGNHTYSLLSNKRTI
jgi:hypothetical protein